jgi:4-hydroxy-4-methyl-2-oxoglutarate aldolase
MIEEPLALTLRRNFHRPTTVQVDAFRGVQTGFVVDAMKGRGALDARIKPCSDSQAIFSGVAVTTHAGPADIMGPFSAIEISDPGDIVVVATDGYQATAVAGDRMLGIAKNRGVKGFVTDGCVRDVSGIIDVGIPCFCTGVTPNSPVCNGPATVGLRITIGGAIVESGDIILGDLDGVVVVPFAMIDNVIDTLKVVMKLEKELDAQVTDGLLTPSFIKELFESNKIKEID